MKQRENTKLAFLRHEATTANFSCVCVEFVAVSSYPAGSGRCLVGSGRRILVAYFLLFNVKAYTSKNAQ